MHYVISFAEQGSDVDPEGEFAKLVDDDKVELVELAQATVFPEIYLGDLRVLCSWLNDKYEGDRPYLVVPVTTKIDVAPYDRELLWRENGRSVSASA